MSTVQRRLTAYLDESQSNRSRDPDCYVLAAALCDPTELEIARTAMASLLLPGQTKVHWRDEQPARKRKIAETIAQLPLMHLIVVRDGRPGERAERRRRHCLERMLFELDELEVARAIAESRGRADDLRDRRLLDAQRAKQAVSSELLIDHVPGPKDPLLWVPDAVCGAITLARTGNPGYLDMIETAVAVQVIRIVAP
ncbi:hypothetical protein FOS14_19665 [Skermania sp. ID1734]|uniref:hypothetical protein n=1 Tax=Skermania sp. ID1734 TaxID=2597516 RepID=UPI0011813A22|nr:hypothetical protein [Skermania sp. ID1734]TSD94861.1 hypothetical protein FOS14_19665 [Skermania sp. ID1734]